MTLERLRKNKRVELIDDERKIGNGLLVTLKQGWTFDALADNRVAGADTLTELQQLISRASRFDGPFDD